MFYNPCSILLSVPCRYLLPIINGLFWVVFPDVISLLLYQSYREFPRLRQGNWFACLSQLVTELLSGHATALCFMTHIYTLHIQNIFTLLFSNFVLSRIAFTAQYRAANPFQSCFRLTQVCALKSQSIFTFSEFFKYV